MDFKEQDCGHQDDDGVGEKRSKMAIFVSTCRELLLQITWMASARTHSMHRRNHAPERTDRMGTVTIRASLYLHCLHARSSPW